VRLAPDEGAEMSNVETHLDLMDAFLDHAEAWSVARPILPNLLRQQIVEITQCRLQTGYSSHLHDADVALTCAIRDFQFGRSDQKLDGVRECLRIYRGAALASKHCHSPIQRLIEIAINRRSWDAAIAEAA